MYILGESIDLAVTTDNGADADIPMIIHKDVIASISVTNWETIFFLGMPIALKTPTSYFLSWMLKMLRTIKMLPPTNRDKMKESMAKFLVLLMGEKYSLNFWTPEKSTLYPTSSVLF